MLLIVRVSSRRSCVGRFVKAGGSRCRLRRTGLVVTRFNRYVRNPMYLGLLVAMPGEAVLFGSVALVLVWAVAFWILTASFVRWYEEPTLLRNTAANMRSIDTTCMGGCRACIHGPRGLRTNRSGSGHILPSCFVIST